MNTLAQPAERSIHYRRRWFYVLWCGLLLFAMAAWLAWETPRLSTQAKVAVKLTLGNLPEGVKAQVWAGPREASPTGEWDGSAAAVDLGLAQGKAVNLPSLSLPVGYRRWVADYIPRKTWDLLVFRLEAPGQAARYLALPLGTEWRQGHLRPGRVLRYDIQLRWDRLPFDIREPEVGSPLNPSGGAR